MLKTVSSITNAIGALNYKGTWNASSNSPALASGVGTKGDYYVVGTAGTTTLDGISNWGVGDWATFNGSVWQRVEGGANVNGVTVTATNAVYAGGAYGFVSSNYQANAKNPIWSFGDAPDYGITYFQGSSGISNLDTIGFHFGTATAVGSPFKFRSDGVFNASGQVQSGENFRVANSGNGVLFSGDNNIIWRCGTGTPEGAVTAPVGSLFTRTDGGAGTTLYVKESGTGNTGWVAK